MSNYTPILTFATKDALTAGDPNKKIYGSTIDAELSAIATAITSKLNTTDLAGTLSVTGNITFSGTNVFNNSNTFTGTFSAPASGLTGTLADARLSANVPLLNTNNTFTGSVGLTVNNSAPQYFFIETGVTAQNTTWSWTVDGESFTGRVWNDAVASQNTWLTVQRTANTIDSIEFAATAITLNGVASSDFARLSQANNFVSGQVVATTGGTAKLSIQTTTSGSPFLALDTLGQQNWVVGVDRTASGTLKFSSASDFSATRLSIDTSGNFDFKGGTVTTSNTSASEVGYKGIPLGNGGANHSAGSYTLVLADAGKVIYSSGGTTVTIPANASVAFPDKTVVTIINFSGGNMTISITTDTLYFGGVGSTGSRTLANYGMATLIKIGSTAWVIYGTGVS